MALHLGGLPAPAVQHPVIARGARYYLDLAYPEVRLAIEYDGAEHRTQRRARRDLVREAALTAAGWHIIRFDADVVLFRPDRLVDAVRARNLPFAACCDGGCRLPGADRGRRRAVVIAVDARLAL